MSHLRRVMELNPEFAPAYFTLAYVYDEQNRESEEPLTLMRTAADLTPGNPWNHMHLAYLLLKRGRGEKARESAAEGVGLAIRKNDGALSNSICWRGSLWGFAESVLPACEQAVDLEPDSFANRDSRGLCRALVGDVKGAIKDFQFFVKNGEGSDYEDLIAQRNGWIQELKEGRNPFNDELLKELAAQ